MNKFMHFVIFLFSGVIHNGIYYMCIHVGEGYRFFLFDLVGFKGCALGFCDYGCFGGGFFFGVFIGDFCIILFT